MMNTAKNTKCLFLFAQGRSGSTLLLRLIDAIDGYNICGENWGAIGKLYGFYKAILETQKRCPSNDKLTFKSYSQLLTEPSRNKKYSGFEWYNVFRIDKIQDKLRDLIFEMFNPDATNDVWGFKEISFGKATTTYDRFQEELDFIKMLFPRAKFIFNTRAIEELVKSAWWTQDAENSKQILMRQADFFKTYSSQNPDFTYSVTYHDVINNTETLQGMYDFLGESFDVDKYKSVLERR